MDANRGVSLQITSIRLRILLHLLPVRTVTLTLHRTAANTHRIRALVHHSNQIFAVPLPLQITLLLSLLPSSICPPTITPRRLRLLRLQITLGMRLLLLALSLRLPLGLGLDTGATSSIPATRRATRLIL